MERSGIRFILAGLISTLLTAAAGAQPATAPMGDTAPDVAPATMPATQPATQPAASRELAGPGPAAIVVLDGDINDYNQQMLEQRFQLARDAGARVIILQIDTYGGYVHSGQAISRFIKRQEDLHVIAYIPVKAISAGALIAVAANEIVMEPGSQIGNSGVVTGTGQELSGTARAKAESMVLEEFYDSAIRNGYDPLLLESMVVVERVVHFVENTQTGERRFVDETEYARLMETGEWQPVPDVRNPLDRADSLLTVGSELAHRIGLASEVATDVESFAASRGYEIVGRFAPDFGDHVVAFLNSFAVKGILTTVLLFSLYMSFSSPGQGMPEVVAVCSLGVLLGVPLLTGYAGWVEIVLVLLGLGLIALELFVIPGFGIPGITGIMFVLGGLTLTFAPPIRLPDTTWGFAMPWGQLFQGLMVVITAMTASLLLWWWLSRYLPKLPYANRLILSTGGPGGQTIEVPASLMEAPWPAVGAVGRVVSDLRPGGTVEFFDDVINDVRLADVVSDSGFVRAGTNVSVREVRGNRIVVRPVASA